MPYSKYLSQPYTEIRTGVRFSDGVCYNKREMKLLGKKDTESYNFIHQVKKAFNGVIIK